MLHHMPELQFRVVENYRLLLATGVRVDFGLALDNPCRVGLGFIVQAIRFEYGKHLGTHSIRQSSSREQISSSPSIFGPDLVGAKDIWLRQGTIKLNLYLDIFIDLFPRTLGAKNCVFFITPEMEMKAISGSGSCSMASVRSRPVFISLVGGSFMQGTKSCGLDWPRGCSSLPNPQRSPYSIYLSFRMLVIHLAIAPRRHESPILSQRHRSTQIA